MGRPQGMCSQGTHEITESNRIPHSGGYRCRICKELRDLERVAAHMWADWALVEELLALGKVPFRPPTRMEICIAVGEKRPFYDLREQFLADRLGVPQSTITDALRWARDNNVKVPTLRELRLMTYPPEGW